MNVVFFLCHTLEIGLLASILVLVNGGFTATIDILDKDASK